MGAPAEAQLAISANDNKLALVNGVAQVVQNPKPDTITIIEPERSGAQGHRRDPGSHQRRGAALQRGHHAGRKPRPGRLRRCEESIRPTNKSGQQSVGRGSQGDAARVISTLQAGAGAAGVSINRQGTLALVANRSEGTVSVFGIQGTTRDALSKVTPGGESGVSHDGVHARRQDRARHARRRQLHLGAGHRRHERGVHKARSLGGLAAVRARYQPRRLGGGRRQYRARRRATTTPSASSTSRPSRRAWSKRSSLGRRPRASCSRPDGKLAAVTVMNGSNKPRESPFFNDARQGDPVPGGRHAADSDPPLLWWSAMSRYCARDGTSLTDRGERTGQRRLGGASHRGSPITAATTANALPARREVRNVGKGKNMKKEKKKPKQKK